MSDLSIEARNDIQGIILSGYGHLSHAGFLFLQFGEPEKAHAWLRQIAPQVTTAKPWPKTAEGATIKPRNALNLAFTHAGLAKLGLPAATLQTFPTEFIQGMSQRTTVLGDTGDSAPECWEFGGPNNNEIHALLMLYSASEADFTQLLEEQRSLLAASGGEVSEVAAEKAHRPESQKEPFGFRDGISQPKFEGHKAGEPSPAMVQPGEFLLGYLNEFSLYPPSPCMAATSDPNQTLPPYPDNSLPGFRDLGRNGTYVVFRKLAQDVAGFWRYIEAAVDSYIPNADQQRKAQEMRWLASKLVGRWPSGAPLALSPAAENPALGTQNDFTYRPQDEKGYGCPIGAHVRRANPRDSLMRIKDTPEQSYKTSREHQIVRRGMPYGKPLFPPAAIEGDHAPMGMVDDGQPRGIEFIALNASIKRQFEFVQQTWLNNSKFNGLDDNKDPIAADNDGQSHMMIEREPVRKRVFNLPRFVSTKGGGYFFMPSMTALAFLGNL